MEQNIDTPTFLIVSYVLLGIFFVLKMVEERTPVREAVVRGILWPVQVIVMVVFLIPLVLCLMAWEKLSTPKSKHSS